MKFFICLLMAFLMSNVHLAAAEAANSQQMIPTVNIVEKMNRSAEEAKIIDLISREDAQAQMRKFGLTKEEVTSRLATLSDSEIKQLTKQIDQARMGGDPLVGILVVVVLVLLVIFLAKRI